MIKSNINCKITIYNKLIWETIRICILDFVIYYTLFFPKIKTYIDDNFSLCYYIVYMIIL